jgi:hypothetical protein
MATRNTFPSPYLDNAGTDTTLIGMVAGGVLGGAAAGPVGVAVGAWLGNRIGKLFE